ncbi:hypothetical protein ASD42_19790 [Nocardia sp. Root136]|uniref:hypothetical protein n=1 Tax=Nocardia sp. Root136 TaxID=1736458 RepID=UPI0007005DF1|nr:hypothetical protein [Nocardia sp. Root136]KQY32587.1 hypothetical protein ASD42_19790 [Nocardia sp. Root136]
MAHRSIALGAMLIAMSLLSACSVFGRQENDPPAARDADVMVSIVQSSWYLQTERIGSRRLPFFELRRDGTVFTTADGGAEESMFGVYWARLTEDGIEQVRQWFDDLSFNDAHYQESSPPTDQPTTTVYANFGLPVGVSVYGLDTEPGAQSANREVRRLAGVIDRLRALPDDEHLTVQRRAPYTPTALDIAFQPAVPEDDKQLSAPVRWPFATPLTQRTLGVGGYGTVLCATIDGAEAATIIELMAGHDKDTPPHWSTGATPGSGQPTSVSVTANALLRGQSGCSTAGAAPATSNRVAVEPLQDVVLADPATWNGRYPADRFTTAARLELYAAVPILVRELERRQAVEDASGTRNSTEFHVPTGSDLGWYDYGFVAAEVDGARYVDLEARYEGMAPDPWEPPTWHARIALGTETVTDLDLR